MRLGLGLGFNDRRGGGWISDADYQAILDEATAQGYVKPSAACQVLQNQLVLDLKAAGIWAKADFMLVMANDAATSDFALINWAAPTGTKSTLVNSPTWVPKKGFKTDGATSYVQTPWAPNTGVKSSLNDAGKAIWIYEVPTTGVYLYGNISNAQERVAFGNATTSRLHSGSVNMDSAYNFNTTGLFGMNRNDSANVTLFTNNDAGTTIGQASSVRNLLALNIGMGGGNYVDSGSSVFWYGSNLISENAAFYTALNAYMTGVGAL